MTKKLSKTAVRKLWTEALESGEYKQARGSLGEYKPPSKGGPSYCCLGVLCELAVQHGVIPAPVKSAAKKLVYDRSDADLPYSVQEWVGLASTGGNCDLSGPKLKAVKNLVITQDFNIEDVTLMELNDGCRMSFADIAAVIKSKPNGLFE